VKIKSTLALGGVLAIALVPTASGLARPNTTEPDIYNQVTVTITDTKIIVSDTSATRGDGVDFHVKNIGKKPHNFVLVGDNAIGLAREGLGTPVLMPKKTWVLQVFMDIRGDIPYKSTLRADRTKVGMKGTISVN
jgi:hypothetical protein